MIVQTLAFYVFAAITVASGVMVISSRNPVHSVLFLILAFFNAAALFVLMGAEYLAMVLVVVYVGAVAVLFLFVVMMLDINFVELRQGFARYLPVGGLIGLILLVELVLLVGAWQFGQVVTVGVPAAGGDTSNIAAIGQLIYVFLFQAAGLILLVAMIGAIVLTLRHRAGVRKQNVAAQVARARAEAVAIRKVGVGEGM
jgi:NADH-quinone oxidoreductase subunit J